MNTEKITLWIQVLGGFAILVGLLLVVIELRQTKQLAKLQIVSDGWNAHMEDLRAQLGESFSETRAKACFSPESLTEGEIMEMSQYNSLLLAQIRRKREFVDLGSTTNFTWESLAEQNIRSFLYTKVGRADYATSDSFDPTLKEIAEKVIQEGLMTCEQDYAPYLKAIRAENDPVLRMSAQ